MKGGGLLKAFLLALATLAMMSCRGERAVDMEAILAEPKSFAGSDRCRMCHLEHYDSWKTTLHSRTIQDVTVNRDALIVEINPEIIRADLKKLEQELKVPLDKIYIPKVEEIKYAIGMQWKQLFLVEKNGMLYIAPIQYNAWTNRWVNYQEADWDKRPWTKYCGGCHAMGVDLENNTFSEPRIGCEACHGPGSHHVALPKTAVFDKRLTIVNPATLPAGIRTQICGACHTRGQSTRVKGIHWPVGYLPGRALGLYYKSTSYAAGDVKNVYVNEFAKGHHQQYIDWQQSTHASKGVTCTSCHYVHELGVPTTQFQTKGAGSEQCLLCHRVINTNLAHSIHSFANCVGCHMPKIVKSAESGDTHSHAFVCLLPRDTLSNPKIPNSCQTCHKHKDADLVSLQELYDGLVKKSLLRVHRTR